MYKNSSGTTASHTSVHIQALPLEILSKIMTHSMIPLFPTDQQHANPPQPLQLCLVCRLWYQVGWSNPELWTILTVGLDNHDDHTLERTLAVGDRWLSRSGVLPISMRVIAEDNDILDVGGWKIFCRWLMKYVARLEILDLRVPSECLQAIAMLEPNINLPIVHSLSLECPEAQVLDLSFNVINEKQTLVDVSLTSVYLRFVSLPWQYLTRLRLRGFFTDEILIVLSQTPNLAHLAIQTILEGNDHHPPPTEGVVVLDKLETFDFVPHLIHGSEVHVPNFISMLRTPHLRFLWIFCGSDNLIPLESAKEIMRRSEAVLRTIFIGGAKYPEGELFDLWSSGPSINVMTLEGNYKNLSSLRFRLADVECFKFDHLGKDQRRVGYFLPALALDRGEDSDK